MEKNKKAAARLICEIDRMVASELSMNQGAGDSSPTCKQMLGNLAVRLYNIQFYKIYGKLMKSNEGIGLKMRCAVIQRYKCDSYKQPMLTVLHDIMGRLGSCFERCFQTVCGYDMQQLQFLPSAPTFTVETAAQGHQAQRSISVKNLRWADLARIRSADFSLILTPLFLISLEFFNFLCGFEMVDLRQKSTKNRTVVVGKRGCLHLNDHISENFRIF